MPTEGCGEVRMFPCLRRCARTEQPKLGQVEYQERFGRGGDRFFQTPVNWHQLEAYTRMGNVHPRIEQDQMGCQEGQGNPPCIGEVRS
jgi:hypothetical protein